MADNNEFNYYIHPQFNRFAIVKLNSQVIGGSEALAFSSSLHELITNDIICVVVDMSEVLLMNSSGLGMLVSGSSTLKKNNIELVFASVPEKVLSLLKMTHLDQIFLLYENIDKAIASLNK